MLSILGKFSEKTLVNDLLFFTHLIKHDDVIAKGYKKDIKGNFILFLFDNCGKGAKKVLEPMTELTKWLVNKVAFIWLRLYEC